MLGSAIAGAVLVLVPSGSLPARGVADTPQRHGAARTIVVAADGRGDVSTVQAAVDAVPAGNRTPVTIRIRPGIYRGALSVPADKPFITLVSTTGRARDVVITDNRANGTPKPDGGTWGTSGSATATLSANDFIAQDLTFENSFDEQAHPEITNRQAVAVLTKGDRMVFDRVRFLGNQDTLYANSAAADVVGRQLYRDCYVEGDVDFVFGRATAVFEGCEFRSLTRGSSTNNGYVTAASTSLANPVRLPDHGLPVHQRRPGAHRSPGPAVAPEQRPERRGPGAHPGLQARRPHPSVAVDRHVRLVLAGRPLRRVPQPRRGRRSDRRPTAAHRRRGRALPPPQLPRRQRRLAPAARLRGVRAGRETGPHTFRSERRTHAERLIGT